MLDELNSWLRHQSKSVFERPGPGTNRYSSEVSTLLNGRCNESPRATLDPVRKDHSDARRYKLLREDVFRPQSFTLICKLHLIVAEEVSQRHYDLGMSEANYVWSVDSRLLHLLS